MPNETKVKLNVTVRAMTPEDIPDVQALETKCFNNTWPEESFRKELENTKTATYLVARSDGRFLGFIGAWLILDEAHINTVAVEPGFRGSYAGTMLVWCIFQKALERGCKWATIEVSEFNTVAQRLYESFDFKVISRRKSYYNPGEDALVMWAKDLQTDHFKHLLNFKKAEWEERICLSWE